MCYQNYFSNKLGFILDSTPFFIVILCSALSVNQRCSSNDLIVINDNSEKVAMHFYVSRRKRGRELTNGETERACVRDRASVGREIALVQRSRHLHKYMTEM
jgi:hypothetical protein